MISTQVSEIFRTSGSPTKNKLLMKKVVKNIKNVKNVKNVINVKNVKNSLLNNLAQKETSLQLQGIKSAKRL